MHNGKLLKNFEQKRDRSLYKFKRYLDCCVENRLSKGRNGGKE